MVSTAVEQKIILKHGVTLSEVKEAVLCGAADSIRVDRRPDGDDAFLALGSTASGRRLKIVMFAVDTTDGVFVLGTAYPA